MSQTATFTREDTPAVELGRVGSGPGRTLGDVDPKTAGSTTPGELLTTDSDDTPPHAQGEAERWNRPRGNLGRLAFAFLSFVIAGMNDAAVGVSLTKPTFKQKLIHGYPANM